VSEIKHVKRTVLVDICQTQCLNGLDPVVIEEEALGSLYQVEPHTYILAFDTMLNDHKVTTTVKFSRGVLTVVHIGDVHSRQTFGPSEWYASQFFHDGGSLVCRNFTKKLDCTLSAEGGIVDVLYELWSGDTHLGYFNLELFIR
jgi:uncharacterized beta-barrel protein YwiB (DUF1934 family)